jgi:hypothetical protein
MQQTAGLQPLFKTAFDTVCINPEGILSAHAAKCKLNWLML